MALQNNRTISGALQAKNKSSNAAFPNKTKAFFLLCLTEQAIAGIRIADVLFVGSVRAINHSVAKSVNNLFSNLSNVRRC